MALINHITQLKQKHAKLEGQLQEAKHQPALEANVISSLKRKKLALKDEIIKITLQA
jgi:hypothetical protein